MMRRDFVDVPGGQLHVRRWGRGPEAVLALHQTASSSVMWEAVVATLAQRPDAGRFRVIAPDTPGFGASFVPADPYSLSGWAGDLVALLDAEDLDRVHVIGHHTGAAIGAVLAATAPDRVQTLTMVGAVAMSDVDRASWEASVRGMELTADGAHLGTAWTQVGTIDADPRAHPPDTALQHREVVDKLSAGTRWHEAYLAVFGADVAAALARTRAPALLVCGTADVLHPYVPATLAARAGISYLEVDGGGYLCDQHPELLVDAWTTFLADVAAGAGAAGLSAGVYA